MSSDKQGWTSRETVSYDGMLDENGEVKGPAALDEGVYFGTIISAEAATSGKGKPCIKLVFEAERDYAGNVPVGKLMKAYSTIPAQASTAFRILQISKTFGIDAPTVYGYEELSEFANALVDKQVYCRITQREWDGRTMNNLDRFLTNQKAAEEAGEASANTTSIAAGARKSRKAA
jgi:hypothetical protein